MKILFLGINARYTHSNLALYYLRSMILETEHEWIIQETSINTGILDTLTTVIQSDCDVVCLSAYIWNSEYITKLIPLIKTVKSECIIVIGGPEVTYPNLEMNRVINEVDFCIVGQGESAFLSLARNNFTYDKNVIIGDRISIKNLPFPYLECDKENLNGKYVYYEASRGCPYRCSFCLSSRDDIEFEYKDLEVVKTELRLLISFNPRVVKLVDRSFNANREFAREIWKYLAELNSGVTFHFEIKPDLITDTDLKLLSSLPKDLVQFEVGLQSTNPATLNAISRKSKFDTIRAILNNVNELENIHVHLDLIAGLPYEDIDSFANSFNQAISTNPQKLQLGFLKVLPGTEMAELVEEFGMHFMRTPPYQVLSNKWISYNELATLDTITHFFDVYYNSERLRETMAYITSNVDNPFSFFVSLTKYCLKHNFEPKKDYNKAFSLLYKFIEEYYPDLICYCRDAMLYDWCINIHNPNIPHELVNTEMPILKNKVYSILRNTDEELPNALTLSKPFIKKALFAVFENKKFIKSKLCNHNLMIVYKTDEVKHIAFSLE